MAKMTLSSLKTYVEGWLTANLQANANYSITRDNIYEAVDKIGKMVILDQDYIDHLPELDGDNLENGTTIEELFMGLVMPEKNTFNYGTDSTNTIKYVVPPTEACAYSFTFGKYRTPISEPKNNISRACLSPSETAKFVGKIGKSLLDSQATFKYALKKQLLGNAIAKCLGASLSTTIAKPTDTLTAEAVIKLIKNLKETSSFSNEGNALNTSALIGSAPSLTLYLRKGIMSVVEVDALAGAINEGRLDLNVDVKVLDDFGNDEVITVPGETPTTVDISKVWGFLVDTRGVKLHTHYNEMGIDEDGYNNYITFTDHYEATGFVSKYVFMHVLTE